MSKSLRDPITSILARVYVLGKDRQLCIIDKQLIQGSYNYSTTKTISNFIWLKYDEPFYHDGLLKKNYMKSSYNKFLINRFAFKNLKIEFLLILRLFFEGFN